MKRTKAKIPAFDYRRYDPIHSADWRFQIAMEHQQRRTRPKDWEDPLIPQLVQFLRRLHRGDTAAVSADLLLAHAIYSAGGPLRDEIEARLLTGQPMDIIARKTLIPIPVLHAYEPAFFDVTHFLRAGDWIMLNVIRLTPGEPVTEGQVWKFLAVAAGPVVLDIMVDDFHHRPTENPALRTDLAAKGSYTVREVATDWRSLPAVAAIVNEGRRLFSRLYRGSSQDAQLLRLQLQSVRLTVASMHRANVQRKSQTGQRNAQEEVSHEVKDNPRSIPAESRCAA